MAEIDEDDEGRPYIESDRKYLLDLANRLMYVPVMHGVDSGDIDRLGQIAKRFKDE